jgi:hypothetical protein
MRPGHVPRREPGGEQRHGLPLGVGVALRARHEHRVPVGIGVRPHPGDHPGEVRVVELLHEDADAPPPRVGAGRRAARGSVVERLDRVEHAQPQLGADRARVVEHGRHRGLGDARGARDVVDRGAGGGRGLHDAGEGSARTAASPPVRRGAGGGRSAVHPLPSTRRGRPQGHVPHTTSRTPPPPRRRAGHRGPLMDNVTHTLAGLVLGEAALRLRPAAAPADAAPGSRQRARRRRRRRQPPRRRPAVHGARRRQARLPPPPPRAHAHRRGRRPRRAPRLVGGRRALARPRPAARAAPPPGPADRALPARPRRRRRPQSPRLDATNDYGVHPFWPRRPVALRRRGVHRRAVAVGRRPCRRSSSPPAAAGRAPPSPSCSPPASRSPGPSRSCRGGRARAHRRAPPRARSSPAARPARARRPRVGGWLASSGVRRRAGAARRQVAAAARPPTGRAPRRRRAHPAPANPFCASAIVVEAAGPGRPRTASPRRGRRRRRRSSGATAAGGRRRGGGPTGLPLGRPRALDRGRAVGPHVGGAPRRARPLARDNCQMAALLRFAPRPLLGPGGRGHAPRRRPALLARAPTSASPTDGARAPGALPVPGAALAPAARRPHRRVRPTRRTATREGADRSGPPPRLRAGARSLSASLRSTLPITSCTCP